MVVTVLTTVLSAGRSRGANKAALATLDSSILFFSGMI